MHVNHLQSKTRQKKKSLLPLTLSTLPSTDLALTALLRKLKPKPFTTLYIFLFNTHVFASLTLVSAMATAASSSIVQPEQQQVGAGEALANNNPEAVPTSGAWQTSGSIGPFFAVISVLTILAVLSCYLGRMWNRRAPTPLESIRDRGCLGWVKRMCQQCITKDVEVRSVGAKVMVCDEEKNDCKVKEGEVPQQSSPHQV